MVADNANNFADAFDALLDEIEAQIALTDKSGARAFEQHDYDQVQQMAERAKQLGVFRDRVATLRLDWEKAFGPFVDSSTEGDEEPGPAISVEAFRAACLARVEKHLKNKLGKRSATSFIATDGKLAVVCAVSREYTHTGQPRYWFGFHPYQAQFLESATQGYLVLGCGTPEQTLVIPFAKFRRWLDSLNTTERIGGMYWHIHLLKRDEKLTMERKKGFEDVDLTEYLLR